MIKYKKNTVSCWINKENVVADKENKDRERAEKALQGLEKHVASLKKKLLEVCTRASTC